MVFFKELLKDETITNRFQGFLPNLMKNNDSSIIGKGFFIKDENQLIGYVDIGNYNESEHAVYIRQAISSNKRGMGYGKRSLFEICDLIFANYPEIENIKARIATDNVFSIEMAKACGFKWIRDDYYGITNPYIKNNKTK